MCAIAALGLISTGAVMAVDGQRTIERASHDQDRQQRRLQLAEEGPGEQAEIDDKGSQAVASKASVGIIDHPRGRQAHRPRAGRPGTRTRSPCRVATSST